MIEKAKDLLAGYSLSRCISSEDPLARYSQNRCLLSFCVGSGCSACIGMMTRRGEHPYVYPTTVILRCHVVRIWMRIPSVNGLHDYLLLMTTTTGRFAALSACTVFQTAGHLTTDSRSSPSGRSLQVWVRYSCLKDSSILPPRHLFCHVYLCTRLQCTIIALLVQKTQDGSSACLATRLVF